MNYYIDKVKESIEFAWKYKFLWVFGFFIAIFSGGGSGNSNFNSFGGDNDTQKMDDFSNDVEDFVVSPAFWIILVVGICVVFVISLIGWYLLSVSKGALTEAVKKDKEAKDLSLKSSWKDGQSHALDIMILDLTGFLLNLVVSLPLIAAVVMGIIFPPMFILLCCLIPFYVLYYIGWTLTYIVAHRYLVLNNAGAWESIKAGFEVVKEKILSIILAGLVSIVPGCAWAIIAFVIIIIPAVIVLLTGFGLLLASPIIGIMVLVVGLLFVVILAAVVNSPYQVFTYAYWTKLIMDWLDEKPAQ